MFMEEAKRLTKEKGTDVQPADVQRWCSDPEFQVGSFLKEVCIFDAPRCVVGKIHFMVQNRTLSLTRRLLQRRYQEMMSKRGSDGGVGSMSSLTEEVSDVLPLRREDGKLTLFDDDVRRKAAEGNVVLPEKFETKSDLRSFMRELLAS